MPHPRRLPFDPIDEAARQWGLRWDRVPAMHAVTSLMRVQQLVIGRLDAILRPHGLTFARYEALVLLVLLPRLAAPGQDGGAASGAPDVGDLHRAAAGGRGLVVRTPPRTTVAACWPRSRRRGPGRVEAATADLVASDFALEALTDAQLAELSALLVPYGTRRATSRGADA